jgi:HAD superfamily hydrolase (TIGR01490 family)
MTPLALFDLDHTLLSGDSDDLWCRFLVAHGQLPGEHLQRNAEMDAAYRTGTVSVDGFSAFYVGQLAGRSPDDWAPWRQRFMDEEIRPRIPDDARALVEEHRALGHTLVLTTATNRVITELTAAELGFPHLIATEVEIQGGIYTGRIAGVPNMREGKVARLLAWLADRGLDEAARRDAMAGAWFYSDSGNDLPLLGAVGQAVVVDPDERLLATAQRLGWPVRRLQRGA